jgi:hypothetical protein
MPEEQSSDKSRGAERQYQNIDSKLGAFQRTIQRLLEFPGLPAAIVDRVVELNQRQGPIRLKANGIWHPINQTLSQADQLAREVKQRLEPHQRALEQTKQQLTSLEDSLEEARKNRDVQPQNPGLQSQVNNFEGSAKQLREQRETREEALRATTQVIGETELAAQIARRNFDEAARTPSAELDAARKEVDELLEEAAALYDEATRNRTLAAAGETVTANAAQFIVALKHHQKQASNFFWATCLGALAFVVFVLVSFVSPPQCVASLGSPLVASSNVNGVDWPHVLVVLGGRLSIIIGAGWLVVFLGKLHARHSQQAVSYQDRLAGLDVIGMMLQHGTQATREKTLERMTSFYLTQDDNAFRDPPTREPSLRDVERLLRTITKPVGEAVKAVAGPVRRAKG